MANDRIDALNALHQRIIGAIDHLAHHVFLFQVDWKLLSGILAMVDTFSVP